MCLIEIFKKKCIGYCFFFFKSEVFKNGFILFIFFKKRIVIIRLIFLVIKIVLFYFNFLIV